ERSDHYGRVIQHVRHCSKCRTNAGSAPRRRAASIREVGNARPNLTPWRFSASRIRTAAGSTRATAHPAPVSPRRTTSNPPEPALLLMNRPFAHRPEPSTPGSAPRTPALTASRSRERELKMSRTKRLFRRRTLMVASLFGLVLGQLSLGQQSASAAGTG